MSLFIDTLKQMRDFYSEKGAPIEQIKNAEKILNLKFSDEYREYLAQFGAVSCAGHELTGLSVDPNLDVVKVTKENIKKNPNIKGAYYVIEETHIDGIIIWQAESGAIYKAEYKEKPEKIFDSLKEYVASFID